MTWSPLACGIITGKYENGIPESSRASMKVSMPEGHLLCSAQHLLEQVEEFNHSLCCMMPKACSSTTETAKLTPFPPCF